MIVGPLERVARWNGTTDFSSLFGRPIVSLFHVKQQLFYIIVVYHLELGS
jgi:hypothetical protein